jgi:hypothetical protein
MKRNLLFLILPLVFLASCGKDTMDDVNTNNSDKNQKLIRIKSISGDGSVSQDSFGYDMSGKLIKIVSDDDVTTIEYLSGKVKTTRVGKTDGVIQNVNEINLDQNGRTSLINSYNKDGKLISYTERGYNVEGYLTKLVSGYPGSQPTSREFEILNGNVVSGKRFNNNQHTANYFYDYYTTQNKLEYAPYAYFPETDIFGKNTSNNLKEYKEVNLQGKTTYHISFKYIFDNNGFPNKITVTDLLTNKVNYTDEYLFR